MTAPAPTVWPTLSYRDARAAIAFLVEGFGFREIAAYADENDDSVVVHAELVWPPGGGVMLGTERAGNPVVTPVGVGSAYCVLLAEEDVDALHERAVARGGTSVHAPHSPDYGGRACTVADPEGNTWSFGTYRGDSR